MQNSTITLTAEESVETHWAAWVEVVQVLLEDDGDILTGPGGGGRRLATMQRSNNLHCYVEQSCTQ